MATDEFGEKTEQPTERRRQQAREKGNVARSVDLTAAGHMLAAAAVMFFLGAALSRSLGELMRGYLEQSAWTGLSQPFVLQQFWQISNWSVSALLPVFGLMMAVAIFVNVTQFGLLIAPEALQPKLARLNPIEGAKRILSVAGLVKLAVSLAKLMLLVAIAAIFVVSQLPEFVSLADTVPTGIVVSIGQSLINLAFLLAAALVLLGLLDFGFQRWKHEQSLRMTKHEVREEMKNMEGDPLIRQRRRDAHRKLAQARELQQVKDADVVVTNPTHFAVALKYNPESMPAPMVVAKGVDEIALRIRQIAAEYGVPIIERKELAQSLYRTVKVGNSIPVEMYQVFVEIMAYVYRLTGKTAPKLG